MQKHQLEHIIRAAAAITGAEEFVVIGSQAILGQHPNAPQELLVSFEADLFTMRSVEDANLIDGSIGEGSPFHETFGYYAHGVGVETALLPDGWRNRLVPLRNERTGGATGWCLEVHDLASSKLAAGREKDLEFVAALLRHRLVDPDIVQARLSETQMNEDQRTRCSARLERLKRR
jgi:hypothetical protein